MNAATILAAQDRVREEFRSGKRKRARCPGHRLTLEWNGESGGESASTGTCLCGWQESGSSQEIVRTEYWYHITREIARREIEATS